MRMPALWPHGSVQTVSTESLPWHFLLRSLANIMPASLPKALGWRVRRRSHRLATRPYSSVWGPKAPISFFKPLVPKHMRDIMSCCCVSFKLALTRETPFCYCRVCPSVNHPPASARLRGQKSSTSEARGGRGEPRRLKSRCEHCSSFFPQALMRRSSLLFGFLAFPLYGRPANV